VADEHPQLWIGLVIEVESSEADSPAFVSELQVGPLVPMVHLLYEVRPCKERSFEDFIAVLVILGKEFGELVFLEIKRFDSYIAQVNLFLCVFPFLLMLCEF